MAVTLDIGLTLAALAALNAWLGIKFGERDEGMGLSLAFFFLSQLFMFGCLFAIPLLSAEAELIAVGWNVVTLMMLLYAGFSVYIAITLIKIGFAWIIGGVQQGRSDSNRISGRYDPK